MKTRLSLPALDPATVTSKTTSTYPREEWRDELGRRSKQALGDALGLQNFGVNLARLEPGAASALRHWHTRQDEFVYVLEGELTLVTEASEQILLAGDCAGFPAGREDGHRLINRSNAPAVYLEVGDRLPGDRAHYPDADLEARADRSPYRYFHTDGSAY